MTERGQIKKYFTHRGYGFIARKGGTDVFFHVSNYEKGRNPVEGEWVEFSLGVGQGGRPAALNVVRTDPPFVPLDKAHYKLPADTRNVITLKEVDNFYLGLNRLAYFNKKGSRSGFELLLTERDKILYELRPNFSGVNFSAIIARQERLTEDLTEEKIAMKFIPAGRLIIGLGQPSVYETSLTLHHLYGIPYIPASALKGITRNWLLGEYFARDEKKALQDEGFRRIFGGPKTNTLEAQRGSVRFFDSFPLGEPKLVFDIINPHYADYYSDPRGETPPGDYANPRPIVFLALEASAGFRIVLTAREKAIIQRGRFAGERVLDIAAQHLREALVDHGIGAKTALGYGYAMDW
ncbi:MAG: type III-B CRISPR module RAMP protein Cmr6 [Firmicutes bacterium]|nr:type III-B CRISPR module RAMP protein Cmr6 [Bacillota bacterium]